MQRRIKNQKTILLLTITVSFVLFCKSSFAQKELVFEKYSVPQGLSNPTVNTFAQDNEGFLWIATNGGLNRYDGYDFKVYKNDPSDSTSLSNDIVVTVFNSSKGELWVGGFGFISKYDPVNDNFIKYQQDQRTNNDDYLTLSIYEDNKQQIWIGTNSQGVQLLDNKTNNFVRIKKVDEVETYAWGQVVDFTETNDNDLLAADARDGIYRYNDYLKKFELVTLPNNIKLKDLAAIETDDFGRVWIGSWDSEDILKYDIEANKIETVNIYGEHPFIEFQGIINILKDKKGFLWLADYRKGLFKLNPVNDKYSYYESNKVNENSISSNALSSLFEDKFGNIWIGTWNNGINKVNPDREPMKIYKLSENYKTNTTGDFISAITQSSSKDGNNDVIWFGTRGNGLFKFNKEDGSFNNYRYSAKTENSLSSNNILTLAADNENNIWIGTDSTLSSLNTITNEVKRYYQVQTRLNNNDRISDIKIDKTGSIWLASVHGVEIFLPKSGTIKKIPSIGNRRYDKDFVNKIKSIIDNRKSEASLLRVGEQQNLTQEFRISETRELLVICGGEARVSLQKSFDYGWIENTKGEVLWSMKTSKKSFNSGGGVKNRIAFDVIKLEPGSYKLRYISDQGHSYGNWNVIPPADSALWGIQAFTISKTEFEDIADHLKDEYERKDYMLMEESQSIDFSRKYDNIVWIATVLNGIYKYNFRTGEYKNYSPVPRNDAAVRNIIFNIYEDSYGIVWFATQKGLGRLNPATDEMKFFTREDGLPTDLIQGILEDDYRNLWISTGSGLSKYVRSDASGKGTFINFNTKDGLQGYSFSLAAYKSAIGELYFGGSNGINSFFPVEVNTIPPNVVITDFKIFGKTVTGNTEDSPIDKNINDVKEITLSYEQNDISFEFASIHFTSPEKNKIAYKLEGFNKDWIYESRRFVSFTNLDPGDYVFKVKGSNGDGVWSDKEKEIAIVILPPWWKTTFAYISYGILFVFGVFGIDRFQRRRLLSKTRERAKMKEAEMRAQIAEAENERKSKELEEARQLQLSMLPKELPNLPNLDIAVYMKTATEVGGDYYDFHVGMDGTLTVVVGDATGHGMKAGTMVTAAKSLFNSYAENPDILLTFSEMTRCIKQLHFEQLSMCMMMLKILNNKIMLSSAGIPSVLIYRKENLTVEEIALKGMPLGSVNNFPYQLKETIINPGDTILLLTDGLPELFNRNGEMFGYERVTKEFDKVAHRSPEEIIDVLKTASSDWVQNEDPDDDVTFVVIKVK
jgi:serine phosphatase RsbU (regulator of sigma subunit)/ligand-binding sensor domain-containing protein